MNPMAGKTCEKPLFRSSIRIGLRASVFALLLSFTLSCAGPAKDIPPDLNSCRQWAEISCRQELLTKAEFERCYREQLSRCMNQNIYQKDKKP
jgi:hypothetical protein